jgi:hypothetical protein
MVEENRDSSIWAVGFLSGAYLPTREAGRSLSPRQPRNEPIEPAFFLSSPIGQILNRKSNPPASSLTPQTLARLNNLTAAAGRLLSTGRHGS